MENVNRQDKLGATKCDVAMKVLGIVEKLPKSFIIMLTVCGLFYLGVGQVNTNLMANQASCLITENLSLVLSISCILLTILAFTVYAQKKSYTEALGAMKKNHEIDLREKDLEIREAKVACV